MQAAAVSKEGEEAQCWNKILNESEKMTGKHGMKSIFS